MKRKLCILCCIAIIISMVGCTSEKKETNEERSDTKIETNEENEESKDDVIFDHEIVSDFMSCHQTAHIS